MKKYILIVCLALTGMFKAQTSKELIGKWQLVEFLYDNKPQDLKAIYGTDQVFQNFKEDSSFEGTAGKESAKGKWELTNENGEQVLKVTVKENTTAFKVDYFDANKRTISFINKGIKIAFSYKKV